MQPEHKGYFATLHSNNKLIIHSKLSMEAHELYLPMLISLWAIFIGIALVIIGYTDKKKSFTYSGWGVLMANGLVSFYYNILQIDLSLFAANSSIRETAGFLVTAGWLNVAGAFLALLSMLFFHFKKKRYILLAILTILFFAIQFFQYYSLIQKPK